jgi:hypothetical protein
MVEIRLPNIINAMSIFAGSVSRLHHLFSHMSDSHLIRKQVKKCKGWGFRLWFKQSQRRVLGQFASVGENQSTTKGHEGPVSTVSFVQLVSFVVDWFRNLDLILQGATTCSRLRGEFGLKLTHYPASE